MSLVIAPGTDTGNRTTNPYGYSPSRSNQGTGTAGINSPLGAAVNVGSTVEPSSIDQTPRDSVSIGNVEREDDDQSSVGSLLGGLADAYGLDEAQKPEHKGANPNAADKPKAVESKTDDKKSADSKTKETASK